MFTTQILPDSPTMPNPLTCPLNDDLAAAYMRACRAVQAAPVSPNVHDEQLDWFFKAFAAANDSEDVQWSLCYGVIAWARERGA